MTTLKKLASNNDYQFYAINLMGWAGYYLSSYLGAVYWGDTHQEFSLVLLVGVIMGVGLSMTMRPIFQLFWDFHVAIRVIVAIFTAYICSLIWVVPYNFAFWSIIRNNYIPNTWMGYFFGVSQIFYIFLCWICLYFGIKFYKGMQEAKQRALLAAALAQEAQLKMLRYQLNPHFLFNTLNTISTLILDQQNKLANKMLSRLSKFLRHSLESDALQKISLASELKALNLYLNIEKVRFEERLVLTFDISDEAQQCLIPSLILQPITENAIKYAIGQSIEGGTLLFKAHCDAEKLYLSINDDGPGLSGEKNNSGTGVGLRNTQERLQEFYGDAYEFNMINGITQGLEVQITIPKEVQST